MTSGPRVAKFCRYAHRIRVQLHPAIRLRVWPLFDNDRLRRHIEAAYATMCDIHQPEESPRSFAGEPDRSSMWGTGPS
jgi:hypothetical protein